MSNRNSKYKKFLVGAASAALVASAVAPVVSAASFTDVADNNTHKPAIDALSEAGIIKGYEDGSFQPNKTLSRSDVVKLMGKWLESLDYKVPADYKTNPRYTDLKSTSNDELLQYAALVKDHGVFNGYEDGSLGATKDITRENMAVVLVRAYDAVNDTNLVKYVAEQTFDKDVIDLAKAKEEARTAIDVLDYFDITNPVAPNFRPKETTTRGQFASFLHKTIQTENPTPEVPVDPVPEPEPEVEVAEVTSVEAINEQMVDLKGTNLNLLTAENFTVEGNKVTSFVADEKGEKATISFETDFVSGEEVVLTLTEKVEGEADKVTPFKFTYELKIESVVATSQQVDLVANQHLVFNLNGQPANLKTLKDAGYTVEFQATKNVLKDASTGELAEAALKNAGTFSYKVIVSKGDVSVESKLVDVTVLDFANHLSTISEVSVKQGAVTVTSNKIAIENGTATVKAEKATTLNGSTVNAPAVKYSSSNPAIATVNAVTGVVTPISAGAVTIIITGDDAKKEVPLSVVSEAREVAKITASTQAVKLLEKNTQKVELTAMDQYGDEYEGTASFTSKDDTIAKGSGTTTFVDGKATVTITAVTKGAADLEVKKDNKVLSTIAVAVSDDNKVDSRKLETVSPSADAKLDIVKGSTDKVLNLVWNKYNAGGYLIGAETDKNLYDVSSSDANVASVTMDDKGNITVTALTKGTANILIKEGTVTRASMSVTVVDTTPTISSIKFEKTEAITKKGALNQAVLKAEGITLTNTEYTPEIAEDGTIFIEITGDGYSADNDITLGKLSSVYSGTASNVRNLAISHGSVVATNVVAGAEGTIVVRVNKEGQSSAIATSTIDVKVAN